MKGPACVGGQEKDRRAADGGIFISTLLEFVLYKGGTHSPTWRPHKRVAFYLEIWHISYICEGTLATLFGMKIVNFAKHIENKKFDGTFISHHHFKIFINDPKTAANRKATRSFRSEPAHPICTKASLVVLRHPDVQHVCDKIRQYRLL